MKHFIAFLILCVVVIAPIRLVRSETVDCIVVEINGKEIIKLSDLRMEEKFQEAGCLPSFFEGFRNRNELERFLDETVLAKIGMEEIERNLASINRNFGIWVEKRDEWSRGEDVLQIWSGHLDDFFEKVVLLGKIGEEDGRDLKKLMKDWKNFLLVDLFFPNESRFARREDVRKIIRITAEALDVNFSYVERRFLKHALAKRAFDEILKIAKEKVQIIPADIKQYYESFEDGQGRFYDKIKEVKRNGIILKKLQEIRGKVVLGVHSDFAGDIADSGYNLYQFGK